MYLHSIERSFLTGQYPIRLGLHHFVIKACEPTALPIEIKTMPQYFKELGYSTHMIGKRKSVLVPLEFFPTLSHDVEVYVTPLKCRHFIYCEQPPDNAHSVAFSRRSNSPRLIEDETFNDSDIINNLIDYENGQEEPDSLRSDKKAGIQLSNK
ncbi:uncharacterized protein TNCV_1663401 [Trichonephila clavipes]|nr:uncharacterized protein TNCV_1663401 [Trichonephila clavipes]